MADENRLKMAIGKQLGVLEQMAAAQEPCKTSKDSPIEMVLSGKLTPLNEIVKKYVFCKRFRLAHDVASMVDTLMTEVCRNFGPKRS